MFAMFAEKIGSVAAHLEDFVRPTSRVFNYIACAALCIMPIPVFVDVIIRLAFSRAVPGGIEIQEYLMLMAVFFGLAAAQFEGGHIQIDLVLGKVSEHTKSLLEASAYGLSVFILFFMSSQLVAQGLKRFHNNEISKALELPVWAFYFVAALGTLILALAVSVQLLRALQRSVEHGRWGWLILALGIACFLFFGPMIGLAPSGLRGATNGILGMLLLFVFLFLGVPIGFGMAITGFLGMIVLNRAMLPSLAMLGIGPYDTAASYMLTVVPMFILMGELAFHSGISNELFETANKWFGRTRGGIAMSAVAGCAGFAAICGDSLATAVTMGTIAIPEMQKKKYDMSLATGALAAGGTLGIMIPPSVGFIFYAIVTEESIGKLFVAGIFPGIILAALFIIYIAIVTRIKPELAPKGEPTSFRDKLVSLKGVLGMLFLFVLVLGGMLSGIFNAIEGAAVGAVGAFVYAAIKGRVSVSMVLASLKSTLNITCKLLMILMGVAILGYFLAATRLPFALADFIAGLGVNRYIIFACVIVFFLILGCLLNVIPMILLVLPTIFPMVTALGFDPIWFGVVTVLMMEAGQITPPIGVNVFAISSASGVPMYTVFRGIFPFFICMLVLLVLMTIFPQMATFLPKLLF
jgi:tripartite ATP-independent transporter DctM subunit